MGERSTKIRIDKLIALTVQLFTIVLLGALCIGEALSLEALCWFSLFNTVIVVAIFFKVGKRLFSISSMFMIFLAVFHFGQAWLYAFGAEVDTVISYDIFLLYPPQTLFNTLLFSLLAYNLIAFFWLLFFKSSAAESDAVSALQESHTAEDRKIILTFGLILFFVLLVPVFIYDYLLVTITAQYGHTGIYEQADVLSTWAGLYTYFLFAIFMVMLGCDPQKNRWKWIYYYAIGRCLLMMLLTGKRDAFVIPLLLCIFCKHCFVKKYKKRHIILIAVAAGIFLILISLVSYGRGDYSNINFREFFFEKNIIVQILSEFGGTFTTTVLSYNYILSHDFLMGKSYLGALSAFLPLSDTFFPALKEYMSVSNLLNPYSPSGGALGGSLFGEMYINFGYFSLLLTPIFAWVVSKVENVISNVRKNSLFTLCCGMYISYGLWIFVRGNSVDVIFSLKRTLYIFILYFIFKVLLVRRSSDEKTSFDRIQ